jgi:hypothetical protein
MRKIMRIPKVTDVEVVAPYGLRLMFDDGVTRDVDLSGELWGPMLEPLRDPAYFAQVFVDHGTVAWPSGVDLDPLVLHGDFQGTAAPARRHAG